MQTSVRIDGANCPMCFNETLEALARVDGVRRVHGSFDGPCLEIDHDVPLETIHRTIREHLHAVEMFANEIRMVPLEPTPLSTTCAHHLPALPDPATTPDPAGYTVDPSMTLGEIVTRRPALAAELERRGLDYCCHGGRTLADAARAAGLDAAAVADELSGFAVDEPPAAWASLGPSELVDHIDKVHHRHLWAELPRISALVDKIATVHGDRHPELFEVQRLYGELRADLEPHLAQEERELFPLIRRLAAAGDTPSAGSRLLVEQIEALSGEHETVGALLDDLRRVTSGYAVPGDGCASYAACYRALADLEADTHLHVHKENNVLFPAVRTEPAG
ncbi:iron-sulfur cluster repair di-iron protein [Desertimonas flava]|uniref:iron-sulfur cluster repair di-iron protein n=1 Tax=Desertimonas flava TaxID=2064846 RepID=UPI000E3456C8|nr:iron-sulfur cluster repair di-iron protein [Desertimonas flava]